MSPYVVTPAIATQVPLVVSVPHCGTLFPPEIKQQLKSHFVLNPDDTDWFVDQLYSFAPTMGITMITAVYSRWVIDLNRNPSNQPLYTDGRIITSLCPTTTFLGEPLYQDERVDVNTDDANHRLEKYFWPYHNKLNELLANVKKKFGKVLLWDCHSIRQYIPTIQDKQFPDLILGDVDGVSASAELINAALQSLAGEKYSVQHNHPFKGGYITRAYGKPEENQHAIQLEMTKSNYMDDSETQYSPSRAEDMQHLLRQTFAKLIKLFTVQHA